MLLLLLACVKSEPAPFYAPDAPGPFLVGADEDRAISTGGVSLPLEIWFPASSAGPDLWEYDDLATFGALDDAVPDCSSPRPLVLFSHGNGGVRYQSTFFTERLASHGYVVAAPDHVGNTAFDYDEELRSEMVIRRPADIKASLERVLERAQDATDPLYGCVDPEAGFIMSGHSFGGYTTFAVAGASLDVAASAAYCAEHPEWLCDSVQEWAEAHPGEAALSLGDPRVIAAVPMSPAGYEAVVGGLDEIEAPTLILSGLQDTLTPWEIQASAYYQGLVAPRALAGVEGAGHYSFSNACDLLPAYEDCDPPYLAPEEVQALSNTLATAFLGQTLHPELSAQYAPYLPIDDSRLVWEAELDAATE